MDIITTKPCRLEWNNSGAWKLLGTFDAGDLDTSTIVMEAAANLAATFNGTKTGRAGTTLRISSDESVPVVLARWQNADEGWRDPKTGDAL